MSSILRKQATTRLRADDLLGKIPGSEAEVIAAEFWEGVTLPPITATGEEDGRPRDESGQGDWAFALSGSEDGQRRDDTAAGAFAFSGAATEPEQRRDETVVGKFAFAGAGAEPEQTRDEALAGGFAFSGTATEPARAGDEAASGGQAFAGAIAQEQEPSDETGNGLQGAVLMGDGTEEDVFRNEIAFAVVRAAAVPTLQRKGGGAFYQREIAPLVFVGKGDGGAPPADEDGIAIVQYVGAATETHAAATASGRAGQIFGGVASEVQAVTLSDGHGCQINSDSEMLDIARIEDAA